MKKLHVTPILCLLSLACFGQLNLKAGYSLSFLDPAAHNAVIQAHEDMYSESYDEKFRDLGVLHGLDLGLEYRWDRTGVEIGWRVKRNRQTGSGIHSFQSFNNVVRYGLGSFYGGLVQYMGPVRLSASIDYNYVRNRVEFEEPAVEEKFKDQAWGSQFSIGYVLTGRGPISLMIAPFVQVSWTDFDLGPMQSAITGTPSGPVYEDYLNYGITINFLNGPR